MKFFLPAFCAMVLGFSNASAANISSAGVDGTQTGLLQLNQTDEYWWFCIQPDGSRGPDLAGPAGYEADLVTLDYGWTLQTTDRFEFAGVQSPQVQADLLAQVNVIEYVMDTYLPWAETTDNFSEQKEDPVGSTNVLANTPFFNALNSISAYVKLLHGKLYQDAAAFTSLSVYNPTNPFGNFDAAEAARRALFTDIVEDVNAKAGTNFFASYDPIHQYAVVNTFEDQLASTNPDVTNPNDWQDLIVMASVPQPVFLPEPAGAVMACGALLALGARRRRIS